MKGFILLLICTMIWGFGFVGTKWTLVDYSATWSNALRFLFAGGIAFFILLAKRVSFWNFGAFVCSIFLFASLQFQTMGLELTTMAKCGFFTTFYALFTPLITLIFFKQKISLKFFYLLAVAIVGIAF